MNKLVIVRGPSGAGKSTVSKEIFKSTTRPTLLVPEDQVRKLFNDHHRSGHDAARELSTESVMLGLKNGYDVIYEGILNVKTRRDQFDALLEFHPKENYFFYLDVSFDETIRRHHSRPERGEFMPEAMKRWWEYASPTGYVSETIIPENSSLEETVQTIGKIANLDLKV